MEAGPAPSIVQPKSSAAAARVEESDKAAYLVECAPTQMPLLDNTTLS